jgi:hypothetical protein
VTISGRSEKGAWQSIVATLKSRVRLYEIRTLHDDNTEEQARLAEKTAQLAMEATEHVENRNVWRAVKLAYYAGLNDGRRETLWIKEKPLRLGNKKIEWGRKGREERMKAPNVNASELRAELKREYEDNPRGTKAELQRRVADRHGMSARTLRERLKGKLPPR